MTQINSLQVKALNLKNHLASQHNTKLQFSKKVKLSSGTEIDIADPNATRALVALMDMYAVLGGAASHYGGPAALAELMSALHGFVFYQANLQGKNWFDLAHVINDAGHCENGLYALKANYQMAGLKLEDLKKFRSIESGLTGHGEVHCFKQGVYLSNGPLGSALPQSQGLAIAENLNQTLRTTYCVLSDGAAMEGEAKEALAAIPGLASNSKLAPYVLIITDNNTKLSGRIDQDAYSMEPTFKTLEVLGWQVLKVENGNDLQECLSAIEKATDLARINPLKPVAIWAKTVKGIGTEKTKASASGGHGFPCKSPTELPAFIQEIYGQQVFPDVFQQWISELIEIEKKIQKNHQPDSGEKIQNGISKAMIQAYRSGLPVYSVTSDLPGSTGVAGFRKEFPAASLDVGVAESNMISVAAGLTKQGWIPVVDTFAQFGVTKGALPITMAMLSEAPIIGVFSHTGFQDAADGASHQALSYMSMLATIPGVKLYSLCTSEEAEQLMLQVIQNFAADQVAGRKPETSIFFLGRENFPKSYIDSSNNIKYELAKPQIIKKEILNYKNVVLLTTGSMVGEALKASELLKLKNIGSIVINQNCLNQIDIANIHTQLELCDGHLLTIEDHQVLLGFGSFVIHQLLTSNIYKKANYKLKVRTLGVQSQFGQSAYNALELYQKHGLDSNSIAAAATELE